MCSTCLSLSLCYIIVRKYAVNIKVKLVFLLSSRLKNFFNRAREMIYFKRLIQIPKLPEVRTQGEEGRQDDDSDRLHLGRQHLHHRPPTEICDLKFAEICK